MRPPRFRFTVRRMMIVVAVASAAIGAWVMKDRRAEFLERAAYISRFEDRELESERMISNLIDSMADTTRSIKKGVASGEITPEKAKQYETEDAPEVERLQREYGEVRSRRMKLTELREKYRRAARYPWLPVTPDPPEPEE